MHRIHSFGRCYGVTRWQLWPNKLPHNYNTLTHTFVYLGRLCVCVCLHARSPISLYTPFNIHEESIEHGKLYHPYITTTVYTKYKSIKLVLMPPGSYIPGSIFLLSFFLTFFAHFHFIFLCFPSIFLFSCLLFFFFGYRAI